MTVTTGNAGPPLPRPHHTTRCRIAPDNHRVCDGRCVTDPTNPRVAIVALDVNGVLAPEPPRPELTGRGFTGHHYSGPNSIGDHVDLTVFLNHEHGAWLAELVDHGAQLVFASTLRETAQQWIAPRLGLPHTIPFIDVGGVDGVKFGHSVKWGAISDYAGPEPIAWLDDVMGGKDPMLPEDRAEHGRSTAVMQIDPHHGLRRHHIDTLITWLGKHTAALPPLIPNDADRGHVISFPAAEVLRQRLYTGRVDDRVDTDMLTDIIVDRFAGVTCTVREAADLMIDAFLTGYAPLAGARAAVPRPVIFAAIRHKIPTYLWRLVNDLSLFDSSATSVAGYRAVRVARWRVQNLTTPEIRNKIH